MTRRELPGMRDHELRAAVAAGRLVRIRPGWFALPTANREIVTAVAARGVLSCSAALRHHGVWVRGHEMHLAVDRATPRRRAMPVHWVRSLHGAVVLPLREALEVYLGCADELDVVIACDSVINRRLLPAAEVETMLARTARGRRMLGRVDGRAESGIETIVRLALRAQRVRVRTQVTVHGVGRVDLLIGDRLVVEVDGREWHGARFEEDRARDAALVERGYLVLRFSYRRVMDDLPAVEAQILSMVRRRMHRGRTRSPHTRAIA